MQQRSVAQDVEHESHSLDVHQLDWTRFDSLIEIDTNTALKSSRFIEKMAIGSNERICTKSDTI
tara:strand:+ start:133 stop:324 length:192 start_codon:yes stop_codon:yes gene_type:complete